MEFDNLDELIEWEARCVAAAFGVAVFDSSTAEEWERNYLGKSSDITVYWTLDITEPTLTYISMTFGSGNEAEQVELLKESSTHWSLMWKATTVPAFHIRDLLAHHLARGLYQLGFEDEGVLAQLPQLTAHEKLELRLSLTRAFWPQKWLVEQAE